MAAKKKPRTTVELTYSQAFDASCAAEAESTRWYELYDQLGTGKITMSNLPVWAQGISGSVQALRKARELEELTDFIDARLKELADENTPGTFVSEIKVKGQTASGHPIVTVVRTLKRLAGGSKDAEQLRTERNK